MFHIMVEIILARHLL